MANTKFCLYCGCPVDSKATICPHCGRENLFYRRCPRCLNHIFIEDCICLHCGKILYVECPNCHESTFVSDFCTKCGVYLKKQCPNYFCRKMVFFDNDFCPYCHSRIPKI